MENMLDNLEKSILDTVKQMPDELLKTYWDFLIKQQVTYCSTVRTYEFAKEAFGNGIMLTKRNIDSRHSEQVSTIQLLIESYTKMMVFDEYKRRKGEFDKLE